MHLYVRPPLSATVADGTVRVVALQAGTGVFTVGRGHDATVRLPLATVSTRHARVSRAGDGRWLVMDLGSANGTFIENRRLPANVQAPLPPSGTFRVADVELTFELDGEPQADMAVENTVTLARRLVADLFLAAEPSAPRLVVVTGPSAGLELSLVSFGRPYRVGRAPGCELVLDDDDVSREHVVLERGASGVAIRDLGSKNGVEIDGHRLRGERPLRDGAVLVLGNSSVLFHSTQPHDDAVDQYLAGLEHQGDQLLSPELADERPGASPTRASPRPAPHGVLLPTAAALIVLGGVVVLVVWFALEYWK